MAKAKRLLAQQMQKVNLAVELCDARLPLSSRNPDLDRMLAQKTRVLLLCKADLAEQALTRQWLHYFETQGIRAMAYDTTPAKTKQAKAMIEEAAHEMLERGLRRGIQKTIRAMVVGVPNVGKSTFINRLYGGAITIVGDRPGVTRANRWVKVGPYLEVMDTPGMLWPKLSDPRAATRLAYIGTIRDAVYDQQALCIRLLADLMQTRPEVTCERYKIKNPAAEGVELLYEVCRGRGFLLKGGELDTDRACAVVLDEFRDGKVGRITLERPPRPQPQREPQATQVNAESVPPPSDSDDAEPVPPPSDSDDAEPVPLADNSDDAEPVPPANNSDALESVPPADDGDGSDAARP